MRLRACPGGGGALLAGVLVACGSPVASMDLGATSGEEAGTGRTSCSDGAAAAVLAAQGQAHLDLAFAVRDRLQSAEAVAFAEKTITDCSLALLQCAGALRADAIAPVQSATSNAIALSAKLAVQSLTAPNGAGLDPAYLAHEVLALAEDVGVIDQLVTPNVHDGRLGHVVARTRDLVVQRESIARQLARTIDSCGGP